MPIVRAPTSHPSAVTGVLKSIQVHFMKSPAGHYRNAALNKRDSLHVFRQSSSPFHSDFLPPAGLEEYCFARSQLPHPTLCPIIKFQPGAFCPTQTSPVPQTSKTPITTLHPGRPGTPLPAGQNHLALISPPFEAAVKGKALSSPLLLFLLSFFGKAGWPPLN